MTQHDGATPSASHLDDQFTKELFVRKVLLRLPQFFEGISSTALIRCVLLSAAISATGVRRDQAEHVAILQYKVQAIRRSDGAPVVRHHHASP